MNHVASKVEANGVAPYWLIILQIRAFQGPTGGFHRVNQLSRHRAGIEAARSVGADIGDHRRKVGLSHEIAFCEHLLGIAGLENPAHIGLRQERLVNLFQVLAKGSRDLNAEAG